MNKIRYLLLLTVLLTTSFSCCKDDDDNPPGENENFSEYFTCKINGVEFNTASTFYCNGMSFYYYEAGMGGLEDSYMLLKGKNCPQSKSLVIRLFGIEHSDGYLNFVQPTFTDSCSPAFIHFVEPGNIIEMDSLISGSMNITTFTPRDSLTNAFGKIEGTFEFTVTNEAQDSTIHVTDGVFRFKVPNFW